MRFTGTIFLLLKILWTFARAMIICLQLGLSFLGNSAEAPLSTGLTFYDGVFAVALLVLVMAQQFYGSLRLKKITGWCLAADIAVLSLLLVTLRFWPLIVVLALIVITLQVIIVYRLRKDPVPPVKK
jgi:hypothetical protein